MTCTCAAAITRTEREPPLRSPTTPGPAASRANPVVCSPTTSPPCWDGDALRSGAPAAQQAQGLAQGGDARHLPRPTGAGLLALGQDEHSGAGGLGALRFHRYPPDRVHPAVGLELPGGRDRPTPGQVVAAEQIGDGQGV